MSALPFGCLSPSRIVDWNIHKVGKKRNYKNNKTDRNSQITWSLSHAIKVMTRNIWKTYQVVQARYVSTRPVKAWINLFKEYMKIKFEPPVERCIMEELNKDTNFVEKKNPFTPPTHSMMLEKESFKYNMKGNGLSLLKFYHEKQLKKIKSLLDAVRITATQVYVNTAPGRKVNVAGKFTTASTDYLDVNALRVTTAQENIL
ncbi:hypothetical protein Tco_0341376 [Tanacetum coccineum]